MALVALGPMSPWYPYTARKSECHRNRYGHKRDHDRGVGYKFPPDTLPSAMDGVNSVVMQLKMG